MFRAEVEDMNASLEFPNQTDFGVLQNYFVFFVKKISDFLIVFSP